MDGEPKPLSDALDRAAIERATLESLADGVLNIAADGRIHAINPAAARLLGIEAGPGIGLRDVLPDDGGADDFLDAVLAPVSGEAAPPVVGLGSRRLAVRSQAHRLT